MHPDISQQVRNFVVDTFLLGQADRLRNEDSFLEHGIIDSTGILELVAWLEETYGIQVGDRELIPENFDSVNNITVYLAKKLDGEGTRIHASAAVCLD